VQKPTSTTTLTAITRGAEPLMQFARTVLEEHTTKERRIDIITHFTGDVSYDEDAVAMFIYDEAQMRMPEYHGKLSRPGTYLMVGANSSVFERLQMKPITWAPKARVCIALWPIKPEHLDDITKQRFAEALRGAIRQARKHLNAMNNPGKESRRKRRAQQHAQQSAAT
jgi:hypothetical protein